MHMHRLAITLGATCAALLVAGCATAPSPSSAPSTPPAAAPAPPAAAAPVQPSRTAVSEVLAVEQQWLDSFFRGTPVALRQQPDGLLAVDVPREFCFDAGRADIKPPLAAVLDKVAQSLRRRPNVRLVLLNAPDDGSTATRLAQQRGEQVLRHLRERGVGPAQLSAARGSGAAAVQLRLGPAA